MAKRKDDHAEDAVMTKKQFQIRGMHCVACAMNIDGALEDLSGVKSATTSYARQIVVVEFDERKVSDAQLVDAIKEAGYAAIPLVQ